MGQNSQSLHYEIGELIRISTCLRMFSDDPTVEKYLDDLDEIIQDLTEKTCVQTPGYIDEQEPF